MKNERILDALSRADDKYVEEAAPIKSVKAAGFEEVQGEPVIVTAPKRKIYGRGIAAAACACVAVGGLVIWGVIGGMGNLTEDPAGNDSGEAEESYAQTNSPESNGYHTYKLSKEELDNCAWSCFIPTYAPEGYAFMEEGTYTVGNWQNGVVSSLDRVTIDIWLDDPVVEQYNPINFMVEINDAEKITFDPNYPIYELQNLTVQDIAATDRICQIWCRNYNVVLTVGRTHPELVSDEEIYKMIMSMPYASQSDDIGYITEYLTKEEVYNSPFGDHLPIILPGGYYIAGLSPYTYTLYSVNGYTGISLYISNGVENPDESNYCPIRYTEQTYTANIDTSDKPMYQSISEITAEDIEAAMESGGFYVMYQSNLIEVSFPYPDRVSAEEIYRMIGSVYHEDGFGHLTDNPTHEELYNLPYSRLYAPRLLPEGYDIEKAVHTIYEEGHRWESLDLYISNGIQNVGSDYNLIFFSIAIDSSLTLEPKYDIKTITVRDIEKELKQSSEISFNCKDNAVASITVDKPELITADELYRMIMSMPISGRFEESGIKTGELPEDVTVYNVPVVDINEYYDVQRYPISKDLLGEHGSICGFDGENLYIRDTFREGDFDDIHSPLGSTLSLYNVVTGENWTLVSEIGAIFWFIYADGQHVYYNKALLNQENHVIGTEINILSLDTGNEVTMLSLGPNAMQCSLPMVDKNEIWIATEYEDKNVIMRLDMIDVYNNRTFCEVESFSVEYMTPYKDGVLFETGKLSDDWKREVYFWDGVNEPYLIFTREHDFYTVGDTVLYAEIEGASADGLVGDFSRAFLMSYDLSDPSYGLGVPPSDCLAESDKLYWISDGGRLTASIADGMVEERNGIIYDAKNGWFTCMQSYGDYVIEGTDIYSDTLVLFDVDTSQPTSMESMFGGEIVAVYTVKRK